MGTYPTTEQLVMAVQRTADTYLAFAVRHRKAGQNALADEDTEVAEKLFDLVNERNADVIEMLARRLWRVMEEDE